MLPLAITMGCPAGIGPEIIPKYFATNTTLPFPAVVVGDREVLQYYAKKLSIDCSCFPWNPGETISRKEKQIPVYDTSTLPRSAVVPGHFSKATADAMVDAIIGAVKGVQDNIFSAICTCPISKEALQLSSQHYPGHTELLAAWCKVKSQVMMMAGKNLKVTLATIHCAINEVSTLLTEESLVSLFKTTHNSLRMDFAVKHPKIGVAALNPHAGEGGMFGDEEARIIIPAMEQATAQGITLHGPFPPDTIFYKAAKGAYDAVICMYHDQGLIPFKLLHFEDGVNVTLGLPMVRTSVDHGTAYDIAGRGIASTGSLDAALHMAHTICKSRKAFYKGTA